MSNNSIQKSFLMDFSAAINQLLSGTFPNDLPAEILLHIFNNTPFETVQKECIPLFHASKCRNVGAANSKTFVYRCKTCQTTSTSCICVECFKNGNHEGHDYVLEESEWGWSCDCGSELNWKSSGFCKHHGKKYPEDISLLLPQKYNNFNLKIVELCTGIVKKLGSVELLMRNSQFIPKSLQNGIKAGVKLLTKCCEIDLFQHLFVVAAFNEKSNYVCRLTRDNPQQIVSMLDVMIDMCMSEYVLGEDKVTEQLYETFIDDYLYIMLHEQPGDNMIDMFGSLVCQFVAIPQYNKRFVFNNISRASSFLDVFQLYFKKALKDDFVVHEKVALNAFCSEFTTYLETLEMIMFYNAEYRKLDEHVVNDQDNDSLCWYAREILLRIGYYGLEKLDAQTLHLIFTTILGKYLTYFKKGVKFLPIDVGIDQPISVFYPLLTLCITTLIRTPSLIIDCDVVQQLSVYPFLINQFYVKNGESVFSKTAYSNPVHLLQQSHDIFLFQQLITSTTPSKLFNFIHQVIHTTQSNDQNRSLDAHKLCILRFLINSISDPLYCSQLNQDDLVQYLIIHAIAGNIISPRSVLKTIPMPMRGSHIEKIFNNVTTIVQQKCCLKQEYWNIINPIFPYCDEAFREVLGEQYNLKCKDIPQLYHFTNRSLTFQQKIKELLHSIEVMKFLSDVCSNGIEVRLLAHVDYLLRLMIALPPITPYTNQHINYLKIIANQLINHNMITSLHLCNNTHLQCKQTAVLQKCKEKQHNLKKDNDVLIVDHIDQEEECCIICKSSYSTEENPIGMLAYVESNDVVYSCEYHEWNETPNTCGMNPLIPNHHSLIHLDWKRTDSIDYKNISCCPHRIHAECYAKCLSTSRTQQIKPFMACPICKSLSNLFIPIQQDIINNTLIRPQQNISLHECIKTLPDKLESKSRPYMLFLLKTFTSLNMNDAVPRTIQPFFIISTNLLVSAIFSLEIQLRNGIPHQYENQLIALQNIFAAITELSKRLPKQMKIDILNELNNFKVVHSPITLLVRCIVIQPNNVDTFINYANAHHLMQVYSKLHHIKKDVPFHCELLQEECSESLQQLPLETCADKLSITHLRRVSLISQLLSNNPSINQLPQSFMDPTSLIHQYNLLQHTCLGWVQAPTIPKPFHFIQLPKTYNKLIEQVMQMKCVHCNVSGKAIIDSSALCLTCGNLTCFKSSLVKNKKIHGEKPALDHIQICSCGTGVLLVISTATLLVVSPRFHCPIKKVYINEFGECFNGTSGENDKYYLNNELMNKIEEYYISGRSTSTPDVVKCTPQYH
ncbi:E3 ubiquitin-protein ligase [Entamoeba marina]